jgi:CelD/BcsL family acetyltransferase involved in cellulose biosynthesis
MQGNPHSPLLQFGWLRASLAAFDATPCFLAATRGSELVAFAPLVKMRLRGINRHFLAGQRELKEPLELAWSDEAAMRRLIRWLVRGGAPLVLERLPADSLGTKELKRASRGWAIAVARPCEGSPYIALDESWFEPEHHLGAAMRGELRRARREAERLGAVVTEIHAPDLGDLSELLDTAFEIESARGHTEADTAADEQRAVFYRQFAQAACLDGGLRICMLRIGDRVAAAQVAVEHAGGFWLIKATSDARFALCLPDVLLARDTIRYAAEAGATTYEFLGMSKAQTAAWTTSEHRCLSLCVYPLGVWGMLALAADAAARFCRRWKNQ